MSFSHFLAFGFGRDFARMSTSEFIYPGQTLAPRQGRSRATVDAILEAAAQVLEAQGSPGFTTDAVATRAGVSIGTLYRYFADKQAILTALAWRDQRSRPADMMEHANLDALIITGAEPKTADLRDEVYWPELTHLIDDALRLELRVLCSCLASHVAVQHLTGLTRRKRKEKLSGVFDFEVQRGHPLAQALGHRLTTPHSRWNSLDQTDLALIGAEILSLSDDEVDAFTLPQAPDWLCLQGHPEYEPDTLVREFR